MEPKVNLKWQAVICVVVLPILAGCGGGGDGGDSGAALAASMMPVDGFPAGTIWTYQVDKVKDGTPAYSEERRFRLGLIEDPTGPDIHTVTQIDSNGDPTGGNGAGIRRTDAGWEVVSFGSFMTITATEFIFQPFDVNVIMPGVLAAGASMRPGDTFTNTLANEITDYSLKWVGPEEVAGYPDAHRFEFSAKAPRFIATETREVSGVVHVAPNVGPVMIVATRRKVDDSGTVLNTDTYTVTLTDGPN
ncbi:MAG: hypothetical protein ACYTGN_06090 [Planctomycetota bacterium]|jgi:hypothetical protein